MADTLHIELLRKGVEAWNEWRNQNYNIQIDLSNANLEKINLSRADLSRAILSNTNFFGADLSFADLTESNLTRAWLANANLRAAQFWRANLSNARFWNAILPNANFSEADLTGADFSDANLRAASFWVADLSGAMLTGADLSGADLSGADLSEAYLGNANLVEANLSSTNFSRSSLTRANLTKANLQYANLSNVNLSEADLTGADLTRATLTGAMLIGTKISQSKFNNCNIYGLSAWDVEGVPEEQKNLIITPKEDAAAITVDDLEVAQFIYLLLKNEKVKNVIDTITSKAVLILGRFTEERKHVLDAMREELRKLNFTPILFDFDKPTSKDVLGTVETLARMVRFIIADLTDPSSIPLELGTVVPFLSTTPVLPIKLKGSAVSFTMFDDLRRRYRDWVLDMYEYPDGPSLITVLPQVIARANEKAEALRNRI